MDNGNKVLIINLKNYMNKKYFENMFFYHTESVTARSIKIFEKNFYPIKALIEFTNKSSLDNFIKNYVGKTYYNSNVIIEIEENFVINEENNDKCENLNQNNKIEYKFAENYNEYVSKYYERTLKEEGLVFTDKKTLDEQSKVITYLIKKLGSSLIKGESIMNISLPVTIFDKRTLLQV